MVRIGVLALSSIVSLANAQDTSFQKAFHLYRSGRTAEARAVLTGVKDQSALDLSLLGSIEFGDSHLPAAERYLRQALLKEPGLLGARRTMAMVFEAEGKLADAAQALRDVVAAQPLNPTPMVELARVLNLQGKSEEALAIVLKAKSLAQDDPGVLYAVGALCLQMDLIKDGTANLERAASLQRSPATLYALASARVANRDLADAITIYHELIKADPNNAQVHYAMGAAYFLQGRNDNARTCFEDSIALQPDQVESYFYLGQIADQNGDKQRSIELLKLVIARRPDHARAHVALGMVYRSTGQLEESKAEFEAAIRLSPDSQKAHYQLGLVLNALRDDRNAREQLEIANQLRDSSNERVSWQLLPSHASEAK